MVGTLKAIFYAFGMAYQLDELAIRTAKTCSDGIAADFVSKPSRLS